MAVLGEEATDTGTSVATVRRAPAPWPTATLPVVLVVAHLPLLAFYAWLTWEKPHYRFFALVPLGAGWLAHRAIKPLGILEPGRDRVASAMLWGCWGLLALACLLVSPWLGAVAALAQLASVVYTLGGSRLLRAILPAWAFLALAITPPATLDSTLVASLQSDATRFSCRVLDLGKVYHLRDGNVIRLSDRTLLVEEACSGVHSLFAVLAGTFFYAAWARLSIVRGVVLVASAVLWVTVGNALRITAVAWLAERWGIDVASGWPHEALGILIFVVAIGLAASTDAWLAIIADEVALRRSWNPSWQGRLTESSDPIPIQLPALGRTRLSSRGLVFAYVALILAQVWLLGGRAVENLTADTSLVAWFQTLEANKDETLPESWGPFQGRTLAALDDPSTSIGRYSRRWSYRWNGRTATISLDGPFRGWHELTNCYTNQGWSVANREVRPGEPAVGDTIEVQFERPPEQRADLFFGLTDDRGRPISESLPEGKDKGWAMSMLIPRLGYLADRLGIVANRPTYQMQLFISGGNPMTVTERSQALAFFRESRRLIQQSLPTGKEKTR